MPYFHLVFTLPAEITDIAYQNKAVIYDLLLVSAETIITIAAASVIWWHDRPLWAFPRMRSDARGYP